MKALTYAPTGGLVAAPTTSLPEEIGGVRNWDYRYCWLRDATFTLYALMLGGYETEAVAWRDWLLRAAAGAPDQLQIMYGAGRRAAAARARARLAARLRGIAPVRIGNAASDQFQLDVYGEVMDCLHQARRAGVVDDDPSAGTLQRALMEFLEGHWREPDEGIWEVRGPRRHFTHSKVMAWVAADRAVKAVEQFGLRRARSSSGSGCGPTSTPRSAHNGFDADRQTFTQSFGPTRARRQPADDPPRRASSPRPTRASPARSPRSSATARRRLRPALRRDSLGEVDGLPGGEGAFLPCTFWLADNLTCSRAAAPRARRCSSACSSSPTTSGSSPRSTTRRAAAARQLPTGVHPRRPDQHRAQPRSHRRPGRRPWGARLNSRAAVWARPRAVER